MQGPSPLDKSAWAFLSSTDGSIPGKGTSARSDHLDGMRESHATMDTLTLSSDRYIAGGLQLYAGVTLVTAQRHADLFVAPELSFDFAARAAIVPLTIDEFERAALDYPIVFFGPGRRAFAVMGLTSDSNLFIDAKGRFRPGAYIPAYLRRHPFVLVQDPEQGRWVLGIDESSERLAGSNARGEKPLFVDGAPTPALQDIVGFCEAYEDAQQRTSQLAHVLDDLDLFEPLQAHHRPADREGGEPVLLLDYVAINRARLETLEPDAMVQLRDMGALGPCYAHLLSAANWDRLAV